MGEQQPGAFPEYANHFKATDVAEVGVDNSTQVSTEAVINPLDQKVADIKKITLEAIQRKKVKEEEDKAQEEERRRVISELRAIALVLEPTIGNAELDYTQVGDLVRAIFDKTPNLIGPVELDFDFDDRNPEDIISIDTVKYIVKMKVVKDRDSKNQWKATYYPFRKKDGMHQRQTEQTNSEAPVDSSLEERVSEIYKSVSESIKKKKDEAEGRRSLVSELRALALALEPTMSKAELDYEQIDAVVNAIVEKTPNIRGQAEIDFDFDDGNPEDIITMDTVKYTIRMKVKKNRDGGKWDLTYFRFPKTLAKAQESTPLEKSQFETPPIETSPTPGRKEKLKSLLNNFYNQISRR